MPGSRKRGTSFLVGLIEKIVPARTLKRYEVLLYSAGIKFSAPEYILLSIISGIVFFLLVYILTFSMAYSLIALIAVAAGVSYLYPYWMISRRLENMEKNLPDAFFYLASSLKAGISFSEALEDLTTADFGALTDEFRRTVSEIKKGRPTVEALRLFALRNRKSSVIYRSMMIIIEALERGAPMSDVLIYVANDVREVLRIKQERKASTGMQMMFFIITSGFVGPSILGIVAKLMRLMVQGPAAAQVPAMTTVVLLFVIIQGFISGLGIGVIREGKFSAGLKYSFLLAGMGFAIFKGMSVISIGL